MRQVKAGGGVEFSKLSVAANAEFWHRFSEKYGLQPLNSLFPPSAVKVEQVSAKSLRERERERRRRGSERLRFDQMFFGGKVQIKKKVKKVSLMC